MKRAGGGICLAPIVTFLSPSPLASRRAQERLCQWTQQQLRPVAAVVETEKGRSTWQSSSSSKDHDNGGDDLLSKALSFPPFWTAQWDSVVLECTTTKTLLHFLSMDRGGGGSSSSSMTASSRAPFGLLAVQEASSISQARNMLATALEQTVSKARLSTQVMALGRPVATNHLLGQDRLPVLHLPKEGADSSSSSSSNSSTALKASTLTSTTAGALKEVVIPAYDDSTYNDGTTLFLQFAQSPAFDRPATGVYQWKNPFSSTTAAALPSSSVCIRPLPSAKEDWSLPPPSLIFHSKNVEETAEHLTRDNKVDSKQNGGPTATARIGFKGGRKGRGQIMARHADLMGLDVRFCEAMQPTPMFCEAEESLLAASLLDLQSTHVLEGAKGTVDPRTNQADCWVEFRTSLTQNPAGFWAKAAGRSRGGKVRVAKAPDLPYE